MSYPRQRRRSAAVLVGVLASALISCTGSVGSRQPSATTAPASRPPVVTTQPAVQQGPVLEILSPQPGQTVDLPMTVRYVVTGLDQASLSRCRIRLEVSPAARTQDFSLEGASGTLQVPTDKFIPGYRDLRFTVVREDRKSVV